MCCPSQFVPDWFVTREWMWYVDYYDDDDHDDDDDNQ